MSTLFSSHLPELEHPADKRAQILLPMPLASAFDYAIPADMELLLGDFVEVPFGPRRVNGVVWGLAQEGDYEFSKLKPIVMRHDCEPLNGQVRQFIEWVANYTLFPLGAVLRLVMRHGDALKAPKGIIAWEKTDALPENLRLTDARKAVLEALGDEPITNAALKKASGAGDGVIRGLEKAGALCRISLDPDLPFDIPDLDRKGHKLAADQREAADQLCEAEKGAFLLDGVTGSGKTEVYLEAVSAVLARDPGAQILVLLPEIGLTLPFLKRIEERFGAAPAPWHSDISGAMRRRVWRRVLEGQARLVVGARSALFLPFKNLKLIIVDEEHDGAYKQEEGVLYQGRDMAVARGALGGFPVVLTSATPALETLINATEGRYRHIKLTSRYGPAQLPELSLIDMRKNPPQKLEPIKDAPVQPVWLSPPMVEGVNMSLERGEQSLLFLNRRGYAPLTLCRKCGYRMKSPHSDTCLVEHRFENRLVCHHTGYSIPKPDACPQCNAVGGLAACGPGVERIADEAAQRWPKAKLEILSSDRTRSPEKLKAVLNAMRDGNIDILVATQAAAKGHHFPGLTFVGVVDADLGLAGGDLRAAERTYQLLCQVSGRAGRADKPGRAMLQTYAPDAPVLQALIDSDRDKFMAAEAAGRISMLFPPFGRIAAIILRGSDERGVQELAKSMLESAPRANGIEIWGPAPAPIYRLKGDVRVRMLVRARRDINLQGFLKDWANAVKVPSNIRRVIDVDPYSFM